VSVPAYYYKVVANLRPPGVEGIGFILPNDSAGQSIGRYTVSIDSVEAFTGIDFFPVVLDSVEEEIEGNILGEHWGLEMGEVSTTRALDSWGNGGKLTNGAHGYPTLRAPQTPPDERHRRIHKQCPRHPLGCDGGFSFTTLSHSPAAVRKYR